MTWDLRTQDGIVIRGIPDDVPQDHESLKRRVLGIRDQIRMADPTSGMSGLDKFNAGMGKAFSDIGSGAAQLVGAGPSAEDVKESRRLDAPLMKTGAGAAGDIAGNLAAFAPLSVIPGANTVAGAGALGSIIAAFQPTESTQERFINMGFGGAMSAGTQAVAGPVAQRIGEWAGKREAQAATRRSQNAVRDETLRRGQDAGYVLPPSAVNPTWATNRLESVGGKAAIGQEAANRNQAVSDALARRAASLPESQAISVPALRSARYDLAEPYRELAAINPQAAADLETLQLARQESKLQWKAHNRSGDVQAYRAAQAADAQIGQLEQQLEQAAQQSGNPQLVARVRAARVALAQNHEVQRALNRGTGSVDASSVGRALDRGAPLSGDLETIGRFQQAFPSYTREASRIPTPGVSKSEMLAAAVLGTTGVGATDSPYGAAAAALPFLAGPARAAMLSRALQRSLVQPNYGSSALTRNAAALSDQSVRDRAALLARALALPSIPQAIPAN